MDKLLNKIEIDEVKSEIQELIENDSLTSNHVIYEKVIMILESFESLLTVRQ